MGSARLRFFTRVVLFAVQMSPICEDTVKGRAYARELAEADEGLAAGLANECHVSIGTSMVGAISSLSSSLGA